jgi:hypothetical protein
VLLQSSNPENASVAAGLGASFLNKNSHNLPHDLTAFIFDHLGFGDFVFRDRSGKKIARAGKMAEFRDLLHTVPDESIIYHSERNHFSSWLMARGEIQIAKFIQPLKISDFPSYDELRRHLIEICDIVHRQKTRGKIIHFDESVISEEENLFQLSGGSVGGKGRGMVFLNMMIENRELFMIHPDVNVIIPRTAIIGTDEYDHFMEENEFVDSMAAGNRPDDVIRAFLDAGLSHELRDKLSLYLKHVDYPLAIRSSSLFEDSKSQPFSGIYETYFLPNNNPDFDVRLKHLEEAIKLVYASVYSIEARSYLEAVNYKIGEEKMAVLLQGVAGTRHGGRFYPHISGLAQSYNYYPVSYLKPEDGIALLGLGMGRYVVEGERSWRFCPKYPKMDFISQEDMLKETQTRFYAVDLENKGFDLRAGSDATMTTLDIAEAEKDGTAEYLVSVWDMNSGSMKSGTHHNGPRVMNFASILKYGYFPLSRIIEAVLEIITSSMGMPVQIEFAVDLNKGPDGRSTFYILQIKPLLGDMKDYRLDLGSIDRSDMVLYSEHAMGNGVMRDLHHVIYTDLDRFDRSRTLEMRAALNKLNGKMREKGEKYVLLGPGRWGTRDRFLGIPVRWSDISNAQVVVEVELEDFHFDASLGSHFFHNVTSKGVGYFSVPHASRDSFVDWEWLSNLPVIERTEHFIHVRSETPLTVIMDGRKSSATILNN